MSEIENARRRAMLVAEKYLSDFEALPTSRLIEDMEIVAYRLAFEGESHAAISLFVAIADLELAKARIPQVT